MTALARTWWDAFRGRGPDTTLDNYLFGLPVFRPLEAAREMVALALKVFSASLRPAGWLRDMVVECSNNLRTCTIPMMFASLVYVLSFGSVLFAQVIDSLGAADRLGPGFYLGLLRELGTWLTFMVLAGIVGSVLAADLGARRIRQELDALDVLGVDKMRTLIIPRVWAITIVGLILSLLIVLVDLTCMVLLDWYTIKLHPRPQLESIVLVMNPYDLVAAAIKHTILGFFIGIVACQKGLSATGGAEGVGRVVAETVVITFFGIWLINSLFNTGYLTFVPEAIGIRG